MNSLKRIMVEHGEKIALLVVALICAWSVYGMLVKDENVLDMSNGRTYAINQKELAGKVRRAQAHLSSSVRVMPNPEAEKISYQLARRILSVEPINSRVNFEWFAYVQPPAIGVPPLVIPPKPVDFVNIPAEFRTMTGNPQDVRVYSTVDKIVIFCKDSQFVNYPADGSRYMMLWRKAIGSGRGDLPAEVIKKALVSPRSESVKGLADAQPATAATGEGETAAAPAATGFGNFFGTPTANDQPDNTLDASKYSLKQYRENAVEADRRAELDMTVLCTLDTVMKTGWEVVSPKMRVMTVEPTAEVITSLLTDGYTPDTVEMTDAEKAAFKKKKPASGTPAAGNRPNSTNRGWNQIVTHTPAAAEPAAAENAAEKEEVAASEDRYYVFVDDKTQQNMVYRYAVIASIGPKAPPEDILKEEKHRGWPLYVTVEGINGVPPGGGVFAQPKRSAEKVFKTDMPVKTLGVGGHRFKFVPAYLPGSAKATAVVERPKAVDGTADSTAVEDTGPAINMEALVDSNNGSPTSLGWAFKNMEPCFSDFVYTDLVMTPKEYELELVAAFPSINGTPAQATMKLHKVQQDGTVVQTTVLVNPPKQQEQVTWRDFFARDDKGQILWPPKDLLGKDIHADSEMPLAKAYDNKLGKRMQITPIKATKRIDGKNVEFDTGWGVVDVRKIIVRGKRFRDVDGVLEPLPGGDLPNLEQYSVIIAETNPPAGQPRRFARLYRKMVSKASSKYVTKYQYILEPELIQKIAERMKAQGGR